MRLFVGVELDDEVRGAAAAAGERLREKLQRASPGFAARWIPPDNLHITLWFIGETSDERATAIAEALRAPFTIPAFTLTLERCGAFPPSGPLRVLWIGAPAGGSSMGGLYGEVRDRLAPLGFTPERRPYTAHLTIARMKESGKASPRELRGILAEHPAACGATVVRDVTLFRSRLSPRGAVYEPLLRVPLA